LSWYDKGGVIYSTGILMVGQLLSQCIGGEDLGRGLVRSILHDIELSHEEFLRLL